MMCRMLPKWLPRIVVLCLPALVLLLLGAGQALAQNAPGASPDPVTLAARGPGFYLSWLKIAACAWCSWPGSTPPIGSAATPRK